DAGRAAQARGDRLQDPPRLALRADLVPELLRRAARMDRLGDRHLVAGRAVLRAVHGGQPGAASTRASPLVPREVPRVPAGAQGGGALLAVKITYPSRGSGAPRRR